MSWLEYIRLVQIWFCGDRKLRELLQIALEELEAAKLVVAAAEAYYKDPTPGSFSAMTQEIFKYRARDRR